MKSSLAALALLLALTPAEIRGQDPAAGSVDSVIRRLDLKDVPVAQAIRLVAESTGANLVATAAAQEKKVTLYLQEVTARSAIETLCKVAGLWFREDEATGTVRIMTVEEYRRDLVIYEEPQVRVVTLLYPNADSIAQAIEDLYGDRVIVSFGIDEEDLGLGGGVSGGTRRFTRSIGTDDAGADRSVSARRRAHPEEASGERELTPERIAELERRIGALAERGAAPGELSAVREILERASPIYVTVNRQHNLLVLRTSDQATLEGLLRLVVELDRPTPQVLLEMKVLELTMGESFRSVFDLEFVDGPDETGPPSAQPVNPLLPGAARAARNVMGVGNYPLEGGTLVYQFLNDHVRARIQLLERENRVEVLSTPILLASNNRPARLFVGEERVLTTGVSTDVVVPATGATTTLIEPVTEVRDVGNTLLIVPRINADRSVALFVSQDSSSVLVGSATIPVATAGGQVTEFAIDTVQTATIEATVVAQDGLTIALGGLIRTEVASVVEKTPFFGDIPLLGVLFRRTVEDQRKNELLILITPRVITTPLEGEQVTRQRLEALSRHSYHRQGDKALEEPFGPKEGESPEHEP